MEVTFQIADLANLDTLIPLVRDFYGYDGHHFDEKIVRTALTVFFNDKSLGQVWLILAHGAAVGYMILALSYSLNHPGREVFVDEIFIQESHRRHGLGRRAFALAEAWSRAAGAKALLLEVEQKNTRAQAFYRAIGFEDHDQYLMSCWLEDDPGEITLNPADYSDLDTLTKLTEEQQRFSHQAEGQAALAELLRNDSWGKVWLIQAEAQPAGYLALTCSYSLEYHGRDAMIDQLYLGEGYRQPEREIQAIKLAQTASRVLGIKALHRVVDRKNSKTQALYRAAGFEDNTSHLMTKWI